MHMIFKLCQTGFQCRDSFFLLRSNMERPCSTKWLIIPNSISLKNLNCKEISRKHSLKHLPTSFLSNPFEAFEKINQGMATAIVLTCASFDLWYVSNQHIIIAHVFLRSMWGMWALLFDISWKALQVMSAKSEHLCFWLSGIPFAAMALASSVTGPLSSACCSASLSQPPPVVPVTSCGIQLSKAQGAQGPRCRKLQRCVRDSCLRLSPVILTYHLSHCSCVVKYI